VLFVQSNLRKIFFGSKITFKNSIVSITVGTAENGLAGACLLNSGKVLFLVLVGADVTDVICVTQKPLKSVELTVKKIGSTSELKEVLVIFLTAGTMTTEVT
jgi:hypothetical protein